MNGIHFTHLFLLDLDMSILDISGKTYKMAIMCGWDPLHSDLHSVWTLIHVHN